MSIPFKDGGRDWNGCDCFGFVRLVLIYEYGKNIDALEWLNGTTIETQRCAIELGQALIPNDPVSENPAPGDIAWIKVHGVPCHVGVFIDDKHIMQIDKKCGVYIQNVENLKREGRLEGVYRVR